VTGPQLEGVGSVRGPEAGRVVVAGAKRLKVTKTNRRAAAGSIADPVLFTHPCIWRNEAVVA